MNMNMDMWKFYDITHREHIVCNPTSEEKLARLVELFRLSADASVVDIACGKGEFLIRLIEAYGVRVLGIDISPHRSKSTDEYRDIAFDCVITVCDHAAQNCPAWLGEGQATVPVAHIGFPDPAAAEDSEEERLAVFREVRGGWTC